MTIRNTMGIILLAAIYTASSHKFHRMIGDSCENGNGLCIWYNPNKHKFRANGIPATANIEDIISRPSQRQRFNSYGFRPKLKQSTLQNSYNVMW